MARSDRSAPCNSFNPLLSYAQKNPCRHGSKRLTVVPLHAVTASALAIGSSTIVVSASVTLRKLLLPLSRTKTSFCVEQITPAVLMSRSLTQVVILACPPGLPSARALGARDTHDVETVVRPAGSAISGLRDGTSCRAHRCSQDGRQATRDAHATSPMYSERPTVLGRCSVQ